MKTQEFYYQFDKVNCWTIINASLTLMLVMCAIKCPCAYLWPQTIFLVLLCLASWGAWSYKYLKKQRCALVDEKGITLDHCQKLLWKDIKSVYEKKVSCCFRKYPILVLEPNEGIDYQYNFLQRHNGEWTPFSVPLYDVLSKADREALVQIIHSKVKQFVSKKSLLLKKK